MVLMAQLWYVIKPASDSQSTLFPTNSVVIELDESSAEAKAIASDQQVTYDGKPYIAVILFGFPTKAAAQAAAKQPNPSTPGYAGSTISGLTSGLGSGIGALFQAAIWIRVAEVAVGVILIAIGVAKMTNAVPIATKIASVVK
jgi:predicted lipid-binding transport protein (Tim44 family)